MPNSINLPSSFLLLDQHCSEQTRALHILVTPGCWACQFVCCFTKDQQQCLFLLSAALFSSSCCMPHHMALIFCHLRHQRRPGEGVCRLSRPVIAYAKLLNGFCYPSRFHTYVVASVSISLALKMPQLACWLCLLSGAWLLANSPAILTSP